MRLHAVQGAAQSSSGLGVDDERRKSLADKGWARRTVAVNSVGASGAASFELVPGREQFGPGDDAAAEWERQMLQFTEEKERKGNKPKKKHAGSPGSDGPNHCCSC